MRLLDQLVGEQKRIFLRFKTPADVQAYLDEITYSRDEFNRSPVEVMVQGRAHCLDGGVFAAAALRHLGYPPRLVDIWPEPGTDDDHVLAIYRRNGGYGCLAKSNFPGLRSREPVYRTLRELVMSYFELFFSIERLKSLRLYSRPLSLVPFDRFDWEVNSAGVDAIEKRLLSLKRYPLINPAIEAELAPVSDLSFQAFSLGANWDEAFRPLPQEERFGQSQVPAA